MLATHFISLPKFGMFQVNGNKIRKLNGILSHYYILLQYCQPWMNICTFTFTPDVSMNLLDLYQNSISICNLL